MLSRLLIAGAVIVACAVAVFFLFRPQAAQPVAAIPSEATQAAEQAPAEIKPGYVGVAKFGGWRLICITNAGAPQAAGAAGSAVDPAAPSAATNACRVNQEIPVAGKPDQVLLAANFGILGAMHRPALMLRLPSTAHAGDIVTMRIDDSHTLRTPVRNCTDTECLAAASLSDDDWQNLSAAGTVEIAFPIAEHQRILVDLPMNGLEDATAAMEIAQSSPVAQTPDAQSQAAAPPSGATPTDGPALDADPASSAPTHGPAPTAP